MFDLAYTLESYDLIATEGIGSKIGNGIKAVIDFIIRKIKGAIAFLTRKKKATQNESSSRNKFAKGAGKTINREKSSSAMAYSNTMNTSAHKIITSVMRINSDMELIISDISKLIEKQKTDKSAVDRMRNYILSDIESIDRRIDQEILPAIDKLNRAKTPMITTAHSEYLDTYIPMLSTTCTKWETLQKQYHNINPLNDLTQLVSKVAKTNARIVDTIVKINDALSAVKSVGVGSSEWQIGEIKK